MLPTSEQGALAALADTDADTNADDFVAEGALPITDLEALTGLAAHVRQCWDDARDAKNAVLPRLQAARRARLGEYDPQKLTEIREFGGSEVYPRVAANKCRILEAWLRDVYLGQSDKPWSVEPTPSPTMPGASLDGVRQRVAQEAMNVYQMSGQMPDDAALKGAEAELLEEEEQRIRDIARKATSRMERRMEDQLAEGGFQQAFIAFLADFPVYPAALMKGPILRKKTRMTWGVDPETGRTTAQTVEEIVPEWERVDPFRAYPAPGAETPQDGYFIEHVTLSHDELWDWLGSPGVDEEALRAALQEAEDGRLTDWLGFQSHDQTGDAQAIPDTLKRKVFNVDALLFYGAVSGKDLIEWGVEDEIDDPDGSYEACVWLIGSHVIKAHLNYNPTNMRPYYKASYENLPGEFWGIGIPDALEDLQNVAAAALRSLVNNMSIASGPQVVVNQDHIPQGMDLTSLHPWKIWLTHDSMLNGSKGQPIDFFQPNTNAAELLKIIEQFYAYADDFSLIPRYMTGAENATGAGRTASGLSMLMDAANKGLKGVVSNIDTGIFTPLLQNLYTHNMQFDSDETIKGDAQVVARGAISLMQMETLQLRRNEFLQVTANPVDSQIVGASGRAEILREIAKGLELDTSRIVPTRDEMEAAEQQQQQQMAAATAAQQGQMGQMGQAGQQGGGMQSGFTKQQLPDSGAATTANFTPNALTPPRG